MTENTILNTITCDKREQTVNCQDKKLTPKEHLTSGLASPCLKITDFILKCKKIEKNVELTVHFARCPTRILH